MAAFSASAGFVELDEEESRRKGVPVYKTPPNDPIVIVSRDTKVMLEDRILDTAEAVVRSCREGKNRKTWEIPKVTWVNGVPGCGKTTWIIKNFDASHDYIATTTKEAAKDLQEKLATKAGPAAKTKVRTLASVLVNGYRDSDIERCHRLIVDEALMNHFGAIVMAARLAEAREVLLIGDVNQLPYIDRENLFPLHYHRPSHITNISQNLLCTHRNPMDVAYALREVYDGIYSSANRVHSLSLGRFSGVEIPKALPDTLYLVYTQAEKTTLTDEGYGSGEGSRLLTIHEAQGLTFGTVIIVNTAGKLRLHESVEHAVVAISRHTARCTYYTDSDEGVIARFVKGAMTAGVKTIRDYNLKMALKSRDRRVSEAIINS